MLIENNLLTDIEQEIGRLVDNPELVEILRNVLLLSVVLFTVYLGLVSILYSIRGRSVHEVSETFEAIEFLAFREGLLFISYSLILLGIYYLVELFSPSISYPIYFGAWFVFLLLYGLAGVGVKGFILERHRYPAIISAVFGYEIISSHGTPVLIGIENLIAGNSLACTTLLLIAVIGGLLFFFSATACLMSVVSSWRGILLCSKWKRKKTFVTLFFFFAIVSIWLGVIHAWTDMGTFVLVETGLDETAIILIYACFFLLTILFLPTANFKEVVHRTLALFVFNLIAMTVIVGAIFEMKNLAGFAVLFFRVGGV